MSGKRRQIQNGLLRNSAAAYYAAIELHNKPNMPYRYQATVLLMTNAWELLLKAFLRKYGTSRIERKNGSTIEFGKVINLTLQTLDDKHRKRFIPVADNLNLLRLYRNDYAHYCGCDIEAAVLGLLAKASIAYLEFRKDHFPKAKFIDPNLYILPLGFKLPFQPEVLFNPKQANSTISDEATEFINSIATSAKRLSDQGIEESVFVGFNIAFTNVKAVSNADILAQLDENGIPFRREKRVRIVDDPSAAPFMLSDEEFFEQYPLEYKDLVDLCKKQIPTFVSNNDFHDIMRIYIKTNPKLSSGKSVNRDCSNPRYYYAPEAAEKVKEVWEATHGEGFQHIETS